MSLRQIQASDYLDLLCNLELFGPRYLEVSDCGALVAVLSASPVPKGLAAWNLTPAKVL